MGKGKLRVGGCPPSPLLGLDLLCVMFHKSEMVGEIIGWFVMELPHSNLKNLFCHH